MRRDLDVDNKAVAHSQKEIRGRRVMPLHGGLRLELEVTEVLPLVFILGLGSEKGNAGTAAGSTLWS